MDLMSGNQAKIGRIGLQLDWQRQWFSDGDSHLGGYWDTSFANLYDNSAQHTPGSSPYFNDVGIAAVLRFQRDDRTGFYAEAGAGPRYMSDLYDTTGRRHESRFVVNSHAGVGFIWKNGVDLGFKAMHRSSGNVMQPNDAVNMVGVGLRYRW